MASAKGASRQRQLEKLYDSWIVLRVVHVILLLTAGFTGPLVLFAWGDWHYRDASITPALALTVAWLTLALMCVCCADQIRQNRRWRTVSSSRFVHAGKLEPPAPDYAEVVDV